MKCYRQLSVLIAATLLMAGCQSTPVQQSGFMGSYADFETREWSDGALVYMPPGSQLEDLGKYRKIMLLTPEIWYGKQASYQGINPDELKYITDSFVAKFKAAFEHDYPIVTEPGPDVLLLRSAITGVERKYPKRSALGYIPIALLVEAGQSAVAASQGKEVIVYRASLEAEAFDSISGERVAAVIDSRESDEQSVAEGEKHIGMVDDVLDYWIGRFRNNWDKAHGN